MCHFLNVYYRIFLKLDGSHVYVSREGDVRFWGFWPGFEENVVGKFVGVLRTNHC